MLQKGQYEFDLQEIVHPCFQIPSTIFISSSVNPYNS